MAVSPTAPPVPGTASQLPAARGARLAMGAACIVAATIYSPVFAGVVRQWYEDPNAAYGPLVLIAAVVATRQRWPRLRQLSVSGSSWGAMGLVMAAAVYALATLAADVFMLRVSCVVFLAAALWFVCGSAHVRVLAAPLVLCLAAVPPPAALVTELTLPLQLAASQLAAGVLGGIGVDVVREGNVLTLSYITLEVVEACSGMRSVVTLLALVAVYWGTGGPPLRRVLIVAVATVPIALAGNGLRVVATALLASRVGEQAVRGAVHDATGFVAFLAMCAALAGLSALASRCTRARVDTPGHRGVGFGPPLPDIPDLPVSHTR